MNRRHTERVRGPDSEDDDFEKDTPSEQQEELLIPKEKDKPYICPGDRRLLMFIICFGTTSVLAYFRSLIGGDDKFVKGAVKEIALAFLLSIITFQITLWYILQLVNTKLKAACLLIYGFIIYSTIQYDQGVDFVHHGEYNKVLFLFIIFIVNTIAIGIYAIRKFNAWKAVGAISLIVFIYMTVQSTEARNNFHKGLLGKRIDNGQFTKEGEEAPECKIAEMTPFIELLPRRFFNFFTGSEYCASTGWKPFSTLDNDGILTINCPHGKPHYIVSNDFISGREVFTEYVEGEKFDVTNLQRFLDQVKGTTIKEKYTEPVKINAEYVQAFCGDKENFHVRNVKKQEVEDNAKQALTESGRINDLPPNILMMITDSLSRASFIRRLPMTAKSIESLDISKGGKFEIFQFFRFHTSGCCTSSNLRPLFLGYSSPEIRTDEIKNTDDYLLFRNYTKEGYVTFWSNDICQDYFSLMFKTQDSYVDHELVQPFCHYDYSRATKTYSNFQGGPYSIEKRCIAERYVHTYETSYTRQFFNNYKSVPKFAMLGFQEAHESSGAVVTTLDPDFSEFVPGIMNDHPNTILLFMADHGVQVGPYALSPQGKLEAALPTLVMAVPKDFLDKNPTIRDALRYNEQSIVTHFDLRKTLLHLLYYPKLVEPSYPEDSVYSKTAHSMLKEIPRSRTCKDIFTTFRCACSE